MVRLAAGKKQQLAALCCVALRCVAESIVASGMEAPNTDHHHHIYVIPDGKAVVSCVRCPNGTERKRTGAKSTRTEENGSGNWS